ncbi:hypothetical protein [Paenibacillus sp. FSL R7-0273]|uniref:hypothetical protein n=1 Tax=Paenibacillus sp. FSL R7-0273 TaxID=1536772 RepID=UPI0012E0930A|nr:hypothetical protein [Paenibacillus sp. FSL R7-0273]
MRVTIRKVTEQTYWYADCIGDSFDVCGIQDDHKRGLYTVSDGEYNRIILKEIAGEW